MEHQKENFSLVIPSNDPSFFQNTNSDFKIIFDKTMNFDKPKEVAISTIIFPKLKKKYKIIYILCDIIYDSFLNHQSKCILRSLNIDDLSKRSLTFKKLIYIPIRYTEINSINIKIVDQKFNPVQFEIGSVIINLKIRNIEQI